MSNPLNEPLAAILAHELSCGNSVAAEETGWSDMDLVVRMRKPLDTPWLDQFTNNPQLRIFRTNDPHDGGAQLGVIAGKESLVGPT